MVIYSFYIFDRHTECIYRKSWLPHPTTSSTTTISNTGSSTVSISSPPSSSSTTTPVPSTSNTTLSTTTNDPSSSSLPPPSIPQRSSSKSRGGPNGGTTTTTTAQKQQQLQQRKEDDNTKLIFGTIFSLRNIVRKLGGPDDNFISYRTPSYKLHYYETPTNLKFVMITDASKAHGNLRIALHQIYVNLYVEYVVKNPLAPVEHGSHAAGGANNKDGGKDGRKGNGSGGGGGGGVKSELFELGIEKFLSGGL